MTTAESTQCNVRVMNESGGSMSQFSNLTLTKNYINSYSSRTPYFFCKSPCRSRSGIVFDSIGSRCIQISYSPKSAEVYTNIQWHDTGSKESQGPPKRHYTHAYSSHNKYILNKVYYGCKKTIESSNSDRIVRNMENCLEKLKDIKRVTIDINIDIDSKGGLFEKDVQCSDNSSQVIRRAICVNLDEDDGIQNTTEPTSSLDVLDKKATLHDVSTVSDVSTREEPLSNMQRNIRFKNVASNVITQNRDNRKGWKFLHHNFLSFSKYTSAKRDEVLKPLKSSKDFRDDPSIQQWHFEKYYCTHYKRYVYLYQGDFLKPKKRWSAPDNCIVRFTGTDGCKYFEYIKNKTVIKTWRDGDDVFNVKLDVD